ncbi:hypothetical protein B9S64_20060 [Streptomyces sp. SM18]|nr:hypothetical protein B9S64_20060 [Streptomyces sp. SM18]
MWWDGFWPQRHQPRTGRALRTAGRHLRLGVHRPDGPGPGTDRHPRLRGRTGRTGHDLFRRVFTDHAKVTRGEQRPTATAPPTPPYPAAPSPT